MADIYSDFLSALDGLSKAVFSQPIEKDAPSRVTVRPVRLKNGLYYQAERIDGAKAFHENLSEQGVLDLVRDELQGKYRQALICANGENAQYSLKRNGGYKRSVSASLTVGGETEHNRKKSYILSEGENIPALVELGVFTSDYKIVKAKYDKYKQINRFVELVDDELSKTDKKDFTVIDFGCGKSYLTFILYYYLAVKRGMNTRIIGYDLKADVVEHCNAIAKKYGYSGLEFVVSDVSRDTLADVKADMVVTLHACDTATDYALYYAINKGAEYIFSVPCCQHEINAQIKCGGDMDILLDHGIIKERLSALLTDSIRAQVLADMGYNVDMIEFVDFEHSPKNIMLRCKRGKKKGHERIAQCRALADKYGFDQTLLRLVENDLKATGNEEKK